VLLFEFDPQGNDHVFETIGGRTDDKGFGIAVDTNNTVWITGQTCSADFPDYAGTNPLWPGNCGVFVAGISTPNITLQYSEIFAGSPIGDSGTGIAVNANGEHI
jgi:hypothetical protein